MLAVLRCDQRPGDLAGGNGVHRTTVTRWVREAVGLLAARAPRLDRALKKIARKGGGVVLLDGSLIRTRRRTGADNRRNYSGKHKRHGLLVIALTDDRGRLLWVSAGRPGRTSEITACRHEKLTQKLRAAGLGAIAEWGSSDSTTPVRTPTRR
ncbi:transposase family protein [Streptomyces sp. NPDC002763]|uniref:transposase family protein n=1 Tax=Streptomyces sp. NPDC002763 TaxID=3154427 RepID=UPI003316D75D